MLGLKRNFTPSIMGNVTSSPKFISFLGHKCIFNRYEVANSEFLAYEPFGLGPFATDHSLTKVALRPLLVRVSHYTTQLTAASRPYPPQRITNSLTCDL